MANEDIQQAYFRNFITDITGWDKPKEKLARAFAESEFILYSQTILRLNGGGDNRPHIEIFVRLLEEEQNLTPPGTFLPVLEYFHLGPTLDRYVVRKVLIWYRNARREIGPIIHINLCADTLADLEFPIFVDNELRSKDLRGDCLCFEIPDADTLNDETTLKMVRKLKSSSCRIATAAPERDDISFQSAKTLDADFLKIGGHFIRNLVDDKVAAAKVHAATAACKESNIQSIAQHVEDAETLKQLKRIGMDYAQGYGISKPGPLDAVQSATKALAT